MWETLLADLLALTSFQVNPIEDVNVNGKHTPNSYDGLMTMRQEDKVGVELATKAHQPRVQ